MSAGQTVEPPPTFREAAPADQRTPIDHPVDQQLLRETQDEIRRHVSEIVGLAQGDLPLPDFFEAFLQRVTAALASRAGAAWRVTEGGQCQLLAQTNLNGSRLDQVVHRAAHQQLLQTAAQTARSTAVRPHTTTSEQSCGNPTDHLLLIAPVVGHDRVAVVVEVFQRADRGPATERGYQRFLAPVHQCGFLEHLHHGRRHRSMAGG